MEEHRNSLESKLTIEDFDNIKRIIYIAYEQEFLKQKSKLINKFELLKKKKQPKRSTIRTPILQLQPAPLPPHAVATLNKEPNFALTQKSIPYMDIICVTEKTAQNLELAGHPEKGEN